MDIFPAIDLYDGCAVRLIRGDYNQKTVYSDNPVEVAKGFYDCGAEYLHVVDLEGAKTGETPNYSTICDIILKSNLKVEVGGGIRTEQTIRKYITAGVYRVILGTAAIEKPEFLKEMIEKYGDKIAVGVDLKDGFVAINGWTEISSNYCMDFCYYLELIGVKTVICTDISKDGVLGGTNLELYKQLTDRFKKINFIASGGISSISDINSLLDLNLSGAILGKAIYTGNIDLKQAILSVGGGK